MNMNKTPGQILFETIGMPAICKWDSCSPDYQKMMETAAQAVLATQTPVDPYANLKAAHTAGKVIQRKHTFEHEQWVNLTQEAFEKLLQKGYRVELLRVKPWTLPRHLPSFRPLEPGEEWHRNDFTEAMLPDGWRPLLMGEPWIIGDQIKEGHRWRTAGDSESDLLNIATSAKTSNCRTRRPLPPTKQELDRKEFEEWAKGESFSIKRHIDSPPEYANYDTRSAWVGWQAARKQQEGK